MSSPTHPRARPNRCAALTLLILVAGCNTGGDDAPPPPDFDSGATTPNFVGTWIVSTKFTKATGNCASLVGQIVEGQLTVTKTGSSYRISDGAVTLPMTVRGNTGTFSFSAAGVTQRWSIVVYDNDTRMFGIINVTHASCTAEMEVTGQRTSKSMLDPDYGNEIGAASSWLLIEDSESSNESPTVSVVELVSQSGSRGDTRLLGEIAGRMRHDPR